MSIVRSLIKARERLEKEQYIQATEETSPDNNEETLANSLLVPPQQSSGLGTLDYEAAVESITNIEHTRGSYKKYTDVEFSKLDDMQVKTGTRKL